MGKLSQRDQIALLKDCSNIVVEGADSMAPSLCREGCKILELLRKVWLRGLAQRYTLRVRAKLQKIYGKKVGENKGDLSIDYNYFIDIEELDQDKLRSQVKQKSFITY